MANQMQLSLDEIISYVLQRVEALSANEENLKTKQNIVNRVLYKKGLITEDEIKESILDEYKMLKALGAMEEDPSEELVESLKRGIVTWLACDTEAIKASMMEYQKKLEELAAEAKKPKIEVANAGVLDRLDAATQKAQQSGGKLIL